MSSEMTTHTDDMATTNQIELVVRKEGLTQRNNGDWHLKLVISAAEMDQRVALAPMGAQFSCLLVEIAADDKPLHDHAAQERQAWRELDAVKQAAIRCGEPIFWAFLSEEMFGDAVRITGEEAAARTVREHCGVESRADLAKPGMSEAREKWSRLDHKFQAWKAKENA